MKFLDKIRAKSDREKKVIIWTVLIIIGLFFLILWVYTSQKSIRGLKKQDVINQVNFPSEQEVPKMESPNKEDMEELENLLEQLEQEQKQKNAQ